MRVAIDAGHGAAGSIWGSALYVRALLAALNERTRADDGSGVAVDALSGPARMPDVVWEQLLLSRRLSAGSYDVVHAPNCFLPLRRPCAGVVTVHDLAFEEHFGDFRLRTAVKFRALARAAVRSAERVICPSAFTAADVCDRYGVDSAVVRVIPQAGVLALGSAPVPEGRYILAVSALRAKKNLGVLIDAFRAVSRRGLPHRLVIAGPDAGHGSTLQAMAAGLDVEFTGAVSDERLDALVRGAELLVHPSVYEGFGFVVVEAMQRATPVVVANATALPETAAGAAECFEPTDSEGLGGLLVDLLTDEARRAELARRGVERAAAFSWKRTAAETVAVYEEAAALRSP